MHSKFTSSFKGAAKGCGCRVKDIFISCILFSSVTNIKNDIIIQFYTVFEVIFTVLSKKLTACIRDRTVEQDDDDAT